MINIKANESNNDVKMNNKNYKHNKKDKDKNDDSHNTYCV